MIKHNEVCERELFITEEQGGFVSAPRVHTALTAGLEKRLLTWVARRIPVAIGPDHLTILGFVCQLLAAGTYAMASRDRHFLWLVNVFLFLNWFGDSLDGTLARVRMQQRPRYGFYVDHMADTFGALALMAGLSQSGYLHPLIAAGMLAGYYILSIESYLTTYTIGRFHLSYWIFGPTEIRILLAVGNIALMTHPCAKIAGHQFLLFDIGGVIAVAGMMAMAVATAVRHTRALYHEETLP